MAVPGIHGWQNQLLSQLGASPTPANLSFVDAWQRAEGGTAANNPFNTTLSMPGSTSYNNLGGGIGVQNFVSPQQGLQATVNTLLNTGGGKTYAPIVSALRQGTSAQAAAQAVANSPWGTGSGVLRVLGGPAAPATAQGAGSGPTAGGPTTPSLPATQTPSPSSPLPNALNVLRSLSFLSPSSQPTSPLGGLPGMPTVQPTQSPLSTLGDLSMMGALPSALPSAGAGTSVPLGGKATGGSAPKLGLTKVGDPVPAKFQTSVGGEHPTEGLDGFPARDYMAPAGSPTVAPVSGTIVKLSGNDPSKGPTEGPHGPFGWSVYIQGDNGRTYYMTHLGSRDVKVGQTVKAGQSIGTVGDYAKWTGTPDHIHMGVSAPGVTVS